MEKIVHRAEFFQIALVQDRDSGHVTRDGLQVVTKRAPSEAELADHFAVSRPTVREALKRLAAQSLIRTARGAFGGADTITAPLASLQL